MAPFDFPEGAPLTSRLDDTPDSAFVRCALCKHPLTPESARMDVGGRHLHTFMNPAGSVFEMRCFASADGCSVREDASADYSWFPGYWWRYAHCGGCERHLGWTYEREGGGGELEFFALISSRLQGTARG